VCLAVAVSQGLRRPLVQAYPPPIDGGAPQSVSMVLSDMNEAQWNAFMAFFIEAVDQRLEDGDWRATERQTIKFNPMSCPRF
jgi:hypothetical protein